MSFMDKIKSWFSGGDSAGAADSPAGMDPMAEPMSAPAPMAPMPPADPAGMPTSDVAAAEHDHDHDHDHEGHDHS